MQDRLTLCVRTASCTERNCVMDTVGCTERDSVMDIVVDHVVCRLIRTVGWYQ